MSSHQNPAVQYLASERTKGLPFSEAVRVGNTLYLSGQVGNDEAMRLVPGGLAAEARQAMENVKAALERHGCTLDDIVKVTVMLADMSRWGDFNQVYTSYFPRHLPARSAFGASALALGAQVEIECIAVTRDNSGS